MTELAARRPAPPGLHLDLATRRGDLRLEVATHVPPGQVLGVLGPNGAGKTTLLRTLAGLGRVSTGVVELDGQLLDAPEHGVFVPAERRPVGLVFQDYRLFPHLTVRDNVAFAARSRGAGRAASRSRAQPFLEGLALTALADRKPTALSGGQAQRVALARALAAGPSLLLLDEPLAALDARTRLEVRTGLRQHLVDFAGPVLLVTHDPLEAMVMTDRLLVIEDGAVVQEGTPQEVARRPATQYVARLVGLNLYPGRLDADGTTIRLDGAGRLTSTRSDLPAGSRVLAAVRPDAVTLQTGRAERTSQRNVWAGTVAGLELLGDRVRVLVHGPPDVLVDITPAAVADLELAPGAEVRAAVKATEVELYPDPADGRSG